MPTTTPHTVNCRQKTDAQTHSGEQSDREQENVRPRNHSVPGARAHRHCTLRRPGPRIQGIRVTVAICAQTGERLHRAYTVLRPPPPSKGRTPTRMTPDSAAVTPADPPDTVPFT